MGAAILTIDDFNFGRSERLRVNAIVVRCKEYGSRKNIVAIAVWSDSSRRWHTALVNGNRAIAAAERKH
jgi:hypothetical protein